MRKLLLVGIVIFCVNFVHAQNDDYELKDTVIKDKEETYDNIDYLEENYGHLQPGEIIRIEPDVIQETEEPQVEEKEVVETPSTPATESTKPSTPSRKVASSGSSRSSSARKSSSRKRSKRKKISLKRKRPNKIKRKRKMGNRAACPSF